MAKRLFVGSLPYSVDDAKLMEMFSQFGQVVSAKVIRDRDTNRSKGFGFVEYATDEEGDQAIKKLHNSQVDDRTIVVNEARPREDRGGSGDRGKRW